eukprot:scaffold100531_cov29-Tisochrysis_lutea.AAC.1
MEGLVSTSKPSDPAPDLVAKCEPEKRNPNAPAAPPKRRKRAVSGWKRFALPLPVLWSAGGCHEPAKPTRRPTEQRLPYKRGAAVPRLASATRHGAATRDSSCVRPKDSGIDATEGMEGRPPGQRRSQTLGQRGLRPSKWMCVGQASTKSPAVVRTTQRGAAEPEEVENDARHALDPTRASRRREAASLLLALWLPQRAGRARRLQLQRRHHGTSLPGEVARHLSQSQLRWSAQHRKGAPQ